MNSTAAGFELLTENRDEAVLQLSGSWTQGNRHRDFDALREEITYITAPALCVDGTALEDWDSMLPAFLLQCHDQCLADGVAFSSRNMPEGVDKLLSLATAVPPHKQPAPPVSPWLQALNPLQLLAAGRDRVVESLAFIGEISAALFALLRGRSNTRLRDYRQFCYEAGPDAFAIISLTSLLVGMILAYLGAVQLQQFGAEIYVADLVVIGMLREMGVLMTAVVMAGRTGAAYAAQLGTMQTNEEIDAITTMGISPVEFLVLPRVLALVTVMPLLTIYANLLGMVGGGIVAGGMGITPLMYIAEAEGALHFDHVFVGLTKSVIFAILIAVAGCRSGINCGRSSAAVGQAATEAVVTALVYLIVADAAINIICQQVGI
jgi:phospholipid/cholesterol/gamma-HCH transport system permease protein